MYVKKKFTTILKIVALCLVLICGVYCYFCGGISKAVDNVKNGTYLEFSKKLKETDDTTTNVELSKKEVVLNIRQMTQKTYSFDFYDYAEYARNHFKLENLIPIAVSPFCHTDDVKNVKKTKKFDGDDKISYMIKEIIED